MGGDPQDAPVRRTSTLTIVIIIVGCLMGMFVFLATLAALLLPLVSSARPAARRNACGNNMKQIELALLNYHDANKSFPPAYVADAEGKPMHSWRVLILPYLERNDLYQQYDFNEPWNGPHNSRLAE